MSMRPEEDSKRMWETEQRMVMRKKKRIRKEEEEEMKAGAVGAKVKELVDVRRAKGILQRHCCRSAKWTNQQKIKK